MRALVAILVGSVTVGFSQSDTLNRVDDEGKRYGYWKITCAMKNEECASTEQLLEEGLYVDGEKTGIWTEYYSNGVMKSRIQYVKGAQIGSCERFYSNGNRYEVGSRNMYRWVGEYRSYYFTDSLHLVCHFDSTGRIYGDRVIYWPNGKPMLEQRRVKGINDGWFRWYYENGMVKKELLYESGTAQNYNEYPENAPVVMGIEDSASHPCPPYCEVCDCKDGEILDGYVYIFDDLDQIIRIDIYRNRQYVGGVKVE